MILLGFIVGLLGFIVGIYLATEENYLGMWLCILMFVAGIAIATYDLTSPVIETLKLDVVSNKVDVGSSTMEFKKPTHVKIYQKKPTRKLAIWGTEDISRIEILEN